MALLPQALSPRAGDSARGSEVGRSVPESAFLDRLASEIARLPHDWHAAGTMDERVLRAIVSHTNGRKICHSLETGSGKSTLLFSHLSLDHKVFAQEGDNRSITVVRASPLLNWSAVEFIEGPSQATLPFYKFKDPLNLVLLDGPHGYPFPDLEYYYIYPHLENGALFIVDDIQIPTIRRLFEFLSEDEMFRFLEVVGNTAFFERTSAPLFDPHGDGWWLQNFNKNRHSTESRSSVLGRIKHRFGSYLPPRSKRALKTLLRLN